MNINFAFLDSGTGGLPYLKYLKERKPAANCIYVGDTKNFPYGEKSREEIIEKSCECVKKIIDKWNPNAIVIACNTMSVTALEEMRNRFPFTPFIGTVPAIKPASIISKSRVIGLLATNATVNHPYTKKLISDFASDCKVISRGDPELISFIEHKYYFATEGQRLAAVKPAVDFFKSNGCDAIVLACTHFLNMAEEIQMVCGEEIKVVDSRDGVVRHAFDVESEREVIGKKLIGFEKKIKSELYVTGFSEAKDSERYLSFCLQNDLKFGGIL